MREIDIAVHLCRKEHKPTGHASSQNEVFTRLCNNLYVGETVIFLNLKKYEEDK